MKRSKQSVAVILNSDVEGVGFTGELVTVRPGFARNFLFMAGRADAATPKRRQQRESEIAKAEARRNEETTRLRELAEKLAATPLAQSLKVGPTGQVFGSVTAADVAKLLKSEHDLTIKTSNISGVPLRNLGRHTISVKLGVGVTAELTLQITGDKAQAETDTAAAEPDTEPEQEPVSVE